MDDVDIEQGKDQKANNATTVSVQTDIPTHEHNEAKAEPLHPVEFFLVAFAKPFDAENPRDWSTIRKWAVTGVLSATGFNRIMVSTMMAPALTTISSELHMTTTESVMGMSVYLLATAFGPLVIGPLSEVYGRQPVLHATNIWFLIWNIVCGFAKTKALLLATRLLAGFGAGAIYVLAGAVLGDIWRPEQRGRSLGLYVLIPLIGAGVGPLIGGFITNKASWRWMFWSTSIFQVVMIVVSFLVFHETCPPIILQRKSARLRASTGESRFASEMEKVGAGRSASWTLRRSLTRPVRLLLFHPIVQIQALLSSLNYGILYFLLSSYAELWTKRYGQSTSASGLHYLAMCVGEVIGAVLGGFAMDVIYRRLKPRSNGSGVPEYHLPTMLPANLLVAIGLIMYGWCAQVRAFWLLVDVGAGILAFGLEIGGLSLQAYVIDSYPEYVSSASATSQFFRSLTAFGFPLFAPRMYAALGYGWGNSLLAFVVMGICLPAPIFLWLYGAKLRAKARSTF